MAETATLNGIEAEVINGAKRVNNSLAWHQPHGDVGVALAGAGGGVKLDGGLVQVGLDAVPLGLDPV